MADAKNSLKRTASKVEQDETETPVAAPIEAPAEEPPVPETSQAPIADPAVTEDVDVPEGAYIEDHTQQETEAMTPQGPVRRAGSFDDEYVGQGGRYMVHPETGQRVPVYERYIDANGETKTRRAV